MKNCGVVLKISFARKDKKKRQADKF